MPPSSARFDGPDIGRSGAAGAIRELVTADSAGWSSKMLTPTLLRSSRRMEGEGVRTGNNGLGRDTKGSSKLPITTLLRSGGVDMSDVENMIPLPNFPSILVINS